MKRPFMKLRWDHLFLLRHFPGQVQYKWQIVVRGTERAGKSKILLSWADDNWSSGWIIYADLAYIYEFEYTYWSEEQMTGKNKIFLTVGQMITDLQDHICRGLEETFTHLKTKHRNRKNEKPFSSLLP